MPTSAVNSVFETVLPPTADPKYSLLAPFSRIWAWERWVAHFQRVRLPQETEILAVVDTELGSFAQNVGDAMARKASEGSLTGGVRILKTGSAALPEKTRASARRERIMEIWGHFLREARAPIFMGIEDDTLPDLDAYERLLEVMRSRRAHLVQGSILGRWSERTVPFWLVHSDPQGRIFQIETQEYTGQDVVPIQGGGWYCFVCDARAARSVPLRNSLDPPMGPDVCFVYDLVRKGYTCLGVWSVGCIHFDRHHDYVLGRTPAERAIWKPGPLAWKSWLLPARVVPGRPDDYHPGEAFIGLDPAHEEDRQIMNALHITRIPPLTDADASLERALYRVLTRCINLGGNRVYLGNVIDLDIVRGHKLLGSGVVEEFYLEDYTAPPPPEQVPEAATEAQTAPVVPVAWASTPEPVVTEGTPAIRGTSITVERAPDEERVVATIGHGKPPGKPSAPESVYYKGSRGAMDSKGSVTDAKTGKIYGSLMSWKAAIGRKLTKKR